MSSVMQRRTFLFGSLAVAGCAKRQRTHARHAVSVIRAASYQADLSGEIRRLLLEHRVAVENRRVVLKPNLVEFDRERPINTHAVFVAAVSEAFSSLGARSVSIAEGPGHRRATLDMAEAAGYFTAFPGFERRFTDLNLDEVERVRLSNSTSGLRELYLPRTVLSADLLVSLPKLKTHHWAGATLSMKNLFGVVPGSVYGWPKNPLHWAGIHECVADITMLFPRTFAIVDGIEAMEGNGPILGRSRPTGLIVAGGHLPSVDETCCRLMGIDPERIGYLSLIGQRTGWQTGSVVQTGETLQSAAADFELPPGLETLRWTRAV